MDTEAVAFFARSPTEHVTFWPVTEQLLDTAPIATLDGSVSTLFTSLPVPPPTFWAVIVKVTEPRAFTVAVLADLLTFTSGSGHETLTVTVLLELLFCLLEGSFEALTVPALSTFGQEPLEGGAGGAGCRQGAEVTRDRRGPGAVARLRRDRPAGGDQVGDPHVRGVGVADVLGLERVIEALARDDGGLVGRLAHDPVGLTGGGGAARPTDLVDLLRGGAARGLSRQ